MRVCGAFQKRISRVDSTQVVLATECYALRASVNTAIFASSSALPVPMSVLIVPQLEFEEENPENDCDNGRSKNPGHRGSDWLPVVRDHLFQEHTHLGRIFSLSKTELITLISWDFVKIFNR